RCKTLSKAPKISLKRAGISNRKIITRITDHTENMCRLVERYFSSLLGLASLVAHRREDNIIAP
ncbi:hypothetical protein, partial [Limnohabitans sp.]|uniref:hypothetical protein n=1 Tax=Limnohabitans sp. TaxID=1907725 RepID=UPI00286EF8F0